VMAGYWNRPEETANVMTAAVPGGRAGAGGRRGGRRSHP
jgi:hypothetical protein